MGVLADSYVLSVCEIRVTRIRCEVKAEEMAGNGCIMWSFLISSAWQIVGLSKNSGRVDWQCGMHGREKNLGQNFKYLREMGYSESLCSFGRIILEWILTIGVWKNKTSNCYSTGYICTHIF
jgi:hypothetical protein